MRYYNENTNDYNEFDATKVFHESYCNVLEFEAYLDSNEIEGESNSYVIPECMLFDSMVFALNSVEWSVMWGKHLNSVRPIREEKKRKKKTFHSA